MYPFFRRRMSVSWCAISLFSIIAACQGSSNNQGDGSGSDTADGSTSTATCQEGTDDSVGIGTADVLASGGKATGYVCPGGDQDYYEVTIPTGDRLLNVKLSLLAAVSNLNLTYSLFDAKENVVASAPEVSFGNQLSASHCLTPGKYYLVVRDKENKRFDGKNAYQLSYSTGKDQDSHESNNTLQTATALTGSIEGMIACTGDKDIYKIDVPQTGRLIQLKITTAKTSTVDLKYTLVDSTEAPITTNGIVDGTKENANLQVVQAVPKAGTYYLIVEDDQSDDSDPTVAYTLQATLVNELDASEGPKRNDHPVNATLLGTFGGPGVEQFSATGQIGSEADVDYFQLNLPGYTSVASPVLIEMTLTFDGGTTVVDPQIALVFPHHSSPCTKDSCCRVINHSCSDSFDCNTRGNECINRGDIFCADKECSGSLASCSPISKACAGTVHCAKDASDQGRCGAEQMFETTQNGATLKTAHPLMYGGRYYIRISDHLGNEKKPDYDYGKNYQLQVRLMKADAAQEMDAAYIPTVLVEQGLGERAFDEHKKARQTKKGNQTYGTSGSPIVGFIDYKGDNDWFKFVNPCPNNECVLLATMERTGNCSGTNPNASGSGLEFFYAMYPDDSSGEQFAFPDADNLDKSPFTFGYQGNDNVCFLMRDDTADSFWVRVRDHESNAWSWTCGYRLTISVAANGCPIPPCGKSNDGLVCIVP